MTTIIDEEKPINKRYNALITYIQKLSKQPYNIFNPRLYDFYKEYHEAVAKVCITHLFQSEIKVKLKTWGEATDNLNALIDLTYIMI